MIKTVKIFVSIFFICIVSIRPGYSDENARIIAKTYLDAAMLTKVSKTGDEGIMGVKIFSDISKTGMSDLPETVSSLAPQFITQKDFQFVISAYATAASLATEISNATNRKADRLSSGTVGNVAVLNAVGNPVDGGITPAEFVKTKEAQTISGEKEFLEMPIIPVADLSGL